MTDLQSKSDSISRPVLIAALREELSRRARGEMSICRLAAETGVFCKGFRRYTDLARFLLELTGRKVEVTP